MNELKAKTAEKEAEMCKMRNELDEMKKKPQAAMVSNLILCYSVGNYLNSISTFEDFIRSLKNENHLAQYNKQHCNKILLKAFI